MDGSLLERLEVKLTTNFSQPLLNLRVPPLGWRRVGAATGHGVRAEGTVVVSHARGRTEICGLSPRIRRVVVTSGRDFPYASESVIYGGREPLRAAQTREGTLTVIGRAAGLETVIHQRDGRIEFRFGGRTLHTDSVPPGFRRGWVSCRKRSPEPELYLGFGEKTGGLFKNGRRLVMWNTDNADMEPRSDPLYQSCPLQICLRTDGSAHALFFDNPHYSVFRVGGTGAAPETRYRAAGGPLVYYALAGPTLPEVLEQLTLLTGRSPLPPLWMLGHHHSRWDPEESADKILATAREFRRRSIPCDVLHLDIGHMEGYRCFTWDRERFPDPSALIRALHGQGFRVIVIADPGIKRDPAYPAYREGLEQGLFCTDPRGRVHHSPVWPGAAAFPDFTSPEACSWWGGLFRTDLEHGVDGFWIDMNEPSVFTLKRTLTRRVRHRGPSGPPGSIGHHRVHNLYGFLMARATYEGLRALAPDRRPYLFTRSAFTGVQRYAGSWTGDNRSSWEHLRMSIPMLLNLGLSGQPLVGPDLGGFRGRPTAELMARWLETGTLYPFSRNHTSHTNLGQEIWRFGEEVEQIGRRYLQLRYSLIPYLYTLAWEAGRSGAPLLRALPYEFPSDPDCRAAAVADTQLMLGPYLMAAPILWPRATGRQVYLPPAEYWEDWWSGERLSGGCRVEVRAPLDRLPLYVRAGAALPLAAPAETTTETAALPLRWRVYPAAETDVPTEARLYLDGGDSMRYERGDFTLLRLRVEHEDGRLRIRVEREAGTLAPILGGHPGLNVELSGLPGLQAAVDPGRLPGERTPGEWTPWEWTPWEWTPGV